MNKRHWLACLIAVAAMIVCGGCSKSDAPEELVICTTYPVQLLAKDLMEGADNAPEVSLLVPPDTGCPHHFSLSTQEQLRISKSKRVLLLRNGGGVDDTILHAAKNAKEDLIDGNGGAGMGTGVDPHYFSSPSTVKVMIKNMTDHLKKFDSANAEIYEKNSEKMIAELAELSAMCKTVKRVKVVAMHNTLSNLANECGLDLRAVVFPGHVSELPPAELNRLITMIREEQIPYLLTEPQTPEKVVQLLQQETGIGVIHLDPAASGPADAEYGYLLKVMRNNIETLQKELK